MAEVRVGHAGVLRLANSPKLRLTLGCLGLSGLYDRLRASVLIGLHLVTVARAK